ncbi:zinc-dependent metalloprotease [Cellulomonas sp. PS-H5]|uniref:zinc-dependent metalloprotease n=1 Tax=Cellulomonas sp. PS-H5 TaxID=2820400 RepID=UPI001C4F2A0B|nr:zinc-dependent metalloprotease [Cellulomonas sp. PS-H5]MBW0256170.1 zinc-dependent metalloprotease [Cellulomonas sp. PS-H5]
MQPAVDWDLAARLAARAVRSGPAATRAERAAVVADLRAAAPVAAEHVARITRMAPADPAAPAHDVRVVDRASWARANVRALEGLTARVGLRADRGLRGAAGAGQVAAVLGLLSGAVLGQYDPWGGRGTLLLVAPNVLAVERALGVDPADFRLWVTLHEQTHAQQFASAPWLADHLSDRLRVLLAEEGSRPRWPWPARGDGADGADRADRAHGAAGDEGPSGDAGAGAGGGRPRSLLDLLDPGQRVVLDEVGAVMALLEGHADVTMDAVGRTVVPSVRRIRRRFEARRDGAAGTGGMRKALRAVLGMDVKLAQYRDGAAFVRAVRRRVGTDGLNVVWTAADVLPSATEIADPAAWVRRVHG